MENLGIQITEKLFVVSYEIDTLRKRLVELMTTFPYQTLELLSTLLHTLTVVFESFIQHTQLSVMPCYVIDCEHLTKLTNFKSFMNFYLLLKHLKFEDFCEVL